MVVVSGEQFESVLAGARAGSDWAWERLYRELAPTVIGYLRSHGAAEPEDLAGETFLQAVRGIGTFQGDERDFRAWLFTIAHRRLIDERRRRGRRPVQPEDPDVLAERIGEGGDVGEEALARVSDDRVRAALGALPEDQRVVLLLRILGDMTIEEIAETVGKRVGAVKALQRRALRRIEREGLL